MHALWGFTHVAFANELHAAVADDLHIMQGCPAFEPLWQQYVALFATITDTMMPFFAQSDHMEIFNLFSLSQLPKNMTLPSSTGDLTYWLAKALYTLSLNPPLKL